MHAAIVPSRVRAYLSFDPEHDGDLRDRLLEESRQPGSGFEISGGSEPAALTDRREEKLRRQIVEADEVIVICGEHTGESAQMSAEIRIAQEEQKPYLLLWGRRGFMCTRPLGAKPGDSMYSWTEGTVRDQMRTLRRDAQRREIPEQYKRP